MRQIFALALLSGFVLAKKSNGDADFLNFAAKHGKNYKNQSEFSHRKDNWKLATWEVASLNASSSTATYEVNFLADLDQSEKDKMLGISAAEAEALDNGRVLAEDIVLEEETHGRELQAAGQYDWSSRGTKNTWPVKN